MVDGVQAVLFDLFGTVVDWRSSIVRELEGLLGPEPPFDPAAFADRWRIEGYLEPIAAIVRGTRPYEQVESLLCQSLRELLVRHGVELHHDEVEELALAWRRLDPWPDALEGLNRLRRHAVVAPLSNGGFAQLTELSKRAGLEWDCIVSTELFETYKPDPAAYLGAVRLLGLSPEQVMLVAAHRDDLVAAARAGLRVAFVPRPHEWGANAPAPPAPDPSFEVMAGDFIKLADRLWGDAS